MKPHYILLIGIILVTSCSSMNRYVPAKSQHFQLFKLIPVPEIWQNRVLLEKMKINIDGVNNSKIPDEMLLQSELTPKGINIAAISLAGIPIAQAKWETSSSQVKTEINVPLPFDAQQVIHDLQSVKWPLRKIKPALLPGYTVEENQNGETKTRRYYYRNEPVIVIQQQAKQINFKQLKQGYQLTITSLSDNQLKPD